MKRRLTIFAIAFLFIILTPALVLSYTYEGKISPQLFNKWTIESVLFDHSRPDELHLYIWLKNPNKNARINMAVLNIIKGFVIEYMYWNENTTSFCIVHRFRYNIRTDCYEELSK